MAIISKMAAMRRLKPLPLLHAETFEPHNLGTFVILYFTFKSALPTISPSDIVLCCELIFTPKVNMAAILLSNHCILNARLDQKYLVPVTTNIANYPILLTEVEAAMTMLRRGNLQVLTIFQGN